MTTQFMEDSLDMSNCIRRFIMAVCIKFKRPSGENLEEDSARLIVEEVVKESTTVDLQELSRELVSKILTLRSQTESVQTLFQFIVKWVRHDEENRRQFLRDLLEMLPVSGLSLEFYETHIKTEKLLRRNPESLEWVVDKVVPQFTNRRYIAPVMAHGAPQESLFVVDWKSPMCYKLQISNPTALSVSKRPEMGSFSVVSHRKRIYLVCGGIHKKTFMLEEGRSWVKSKVDLYFDRHSPGTIVIEDDLFVIGGCSHIFGSLNSCAKFNFVTKKRFSLPNMKDWRYRPGIGVFEDCIYAVGGFSPLIERFDPREDIGMWLASSAHPSTATIGNFLYACDVIDGRMNRFEFRTNHSEDVSRLRADDGEDYWITSLNDEMYATRGNGSVLKYDTDNESWSEFCRGLDLKYPIIVPWV